MLLIEVIVVSEVEEEVVEEVKEELIEEIIPEDNIQNNATEESSPDVLLPEVWLSYECNCTWSLGPVIALIMHKS